MNEVCSWCEWFLRVQHVQPLCTCHSDVSHCIGFAMALLAWPLLLCSIMQNNVKSSENVPRQYKQFWVHRSYVCAIWCVWPRFWQASLLFQGFLNFLHKVLDKEVLLESTEPLSKSEQTTFSNYETLRRRQGQGPLVSLIHYIFCSWVINYRDRRYEQMLQRLYTWNR